MRNQISILQILTFTFLFFSLNLFAQQGYHINAFTISVAGTSSLHDWKSKVTKTDANANLQFKDGQLERIQTLFVRIPVKGIISTKGSIMDNKTYDALKSEEYPNITFNLTSATINNDRIKAIGELTIAGCTHSVILWANIEDHKNGQITFTGSKDILMNEFAVKPPTALMGSIKTGDKVRVAYKVDMLPNDK